jgi:chondroitin AC lyase
MNTLLKNNNKIKMPFRCYFFLGLWFWAFSDSQAGAVPKDAETIKNRIVTELLATEVEDDVIENLISSQREDGTWPGINYEDLSRTAFEHRTHCGNMVAMSRAYASKGSKYRNNNKLRQAIGSALSHWVEKDYFCENWWHNQIGTPNDLVTVMLLAGKDMPQELVDKAQPIIGRAHLEASGARPSGDRIKIAGILAKNLLFLEDYGRFDEVIRVIEGEIKFSTERGMQHDYSFHHRVDRVNNTLSYGLGYADAFTEWAVYVTDTEYAFSDEKIHHLIDYYLDGICKHLVFGKYPDAGVKNRSVARVGALKPMGSDTPKKLLRTTDYRKDELEEIIKIREKGLENVTRSHSTFYWHSEHFTFQRPHFFTSVRMYSTRNHNMEVPYNSEGLKNHHRGDGTNHLSITGEEYYNIFPVMDYQKIPGATIMQKEALPDENQIQKLGLTDYSGAVTDGMYGAVAFDFVSPHDPLQAKKSWFFFDEEFVCLGAGIRSGSTNPVHTTLNQNLLEGNVTVSTKGEENTPSFGTHELKEVQWVHHGDVAYIFPHAPTVYLSNGPVTGNWTDISKQSRTPKEDVTMDVFKLWVDHGNRANGETYAYIVVPGVGVEEAKAYDQGNLEILSNTERIQAVKHKQLEITQAVFYGAGELDLGDGLLLFMDGPGQILLNHKGNSIQKITVADPSRNLARMHFRVNVPVKATEEGITALWNQQNGYSEITVDLPREVYAGKSVVIEF